MKKSGMIVAAVVVVAALAVGGYFLFHKSSKPVASTNSSTTASNSSQSSAPAVNNSVLITKTDSKLGKYLADPSGRALYTYGGDSKNVSNCSGSCIAAWPAYEAKGSTTNLPAGVGVIKRSDDGKNQYTYNGMPLYYFVSDSNGQVTGNNVQNFQVARPAASTSSSTNSQSNSTNSSSSTSSNGGSSSGYPY